MRALYSGGSADAVLAVFGLTPGDIEEENFDVWPSNWPAFCLFQAMNTQWNVGPCGATGMNYTPINSVMELIGIRKKDRAGVFGDFQIMEAEALAVMDEQKPPRN